MSFSINRMLLFPFVFPSGIPLTPDVLQLNIYQKNSNEIYPALMRRNARRSQLGMCTSSSNPLLGPESALSGISCQQRWGCSWAANYLLMPGPVQSHLWMDSPLPLMHARHISSRWQAAICLVNVSRLLKFKQAVWNATLAWQAVLFQCKKTYFQ